VVGVKTQTFPTGLNKLPKGVIYTKKSEPKNFVGKVAGDLILQKIKETPRPNEEVGPNSFLSIKKSSQDILLKDPDSISSKTSSFDTALKGEAKVGLGIGKSTVDSSFPFPSPPGKGSIVGKSPYLSNIKKTPGESEKSVGIGSSVLSAPKTIIKASKGTFSKEAGKNAAFGLRKPPFPPIAKKVPNAVGTSDGVESEKAFTSNVPGIKKSFEIF